MGRLVQEADPCQLLGDVPKVHRHVLIQRQRRKLRDGWIAAYLGDAVRPVASASGRAVVAWSVGNSRKRRSSALRERWPEPERKTRLRVVTMVAVGATRLASEIFSRENGTRPFNEVLCNAFDAMAVEFAAS